jgi:hypothetical protein
MGPPIFFLVCVVVLGAAGLAVWQVGQLRATPPRARSLHWAVIASLSEPLFTAGLYLALLLLTRHTPQARQALNAGAGPALLLVPMLTLLVMPLLGRQHHPSLASARTELLRTNLIRLGTVSFVLVVGSASVKVLLIGSLIAAGVVLWGIGTAVRLGGRLSELGADGQE